MKNLLLLFIFFGTTAKAQDTLVNLPLKDGKVYYERIYNESGTKKELFIKAENTFTDLFKDARSVIENKDEENGIITGKGYISFSITGGALNLTVAVLDRCTMTIVVKDGKYKVNLYDFYIVSPYDHSEVPIEAGYFTTMEKKKKKAYKYYDNFNKRVLEIFQQIEDEMNKKAITDF